MLAGSSYTNVLQIVLQQGTAFQVYGRSFSCATIHRFYMSIRESSINKILFFFFLLIIDAYDFALDDVVVETAIHTILTFSRLAVKVCSWSL